MGCQTKAKEPSLHDFLPMTQEWWNEMNSFVTFAQVKCQQLCSGFEPWLPVAFIYNTNHYTKSASKTIVY